MAKKKRILVVDDSEIDRKLMSSVLKKKGFEVLQAENGSQCLELVEMKKPNAVLLDIMMPNLHGKQILHFLRKKHSPVELPVLMVTVKSEASEVLEALALGANDYIVKPVDFDIAMMRLHTHLQISDFNRELVRLKQMETIGSMVATYNHEINNPLSIAIGSLKGMEKFGKDKSYIRLESALWRIADIVKKIQAVISDGKITYRPYVKNTRTIRVK